MAVQFRSYQAGEGSSGDYERVCGFLRRINAKKMVSPNYLWARWLWQFGPYMNMELATYESDVGEAFFCLDSAYGFLKEAMIDYALEHLARDGSLRLLLPDGDLDFEQTALGKGFTATTEKEAVARIDCGRLEADLPPGFSVLSFADAGFEADRYYEAIWRGFDNQRPRNERELEAVKDRLEFHAPHWNNALRVLIVAPNGDYAAHCGMWYLPGDEYAYVEPVFTLPEYRRMGLGKAAVLEGVNRCRDLGAACAYVGSSQQFYYSIGFYPFANETWWNLG